MAFQKYDKYTINKFPTVSLLQSGSLSINVACVDKHFKTAKSVELYYDDDTKRIGIKPYNKKHEAMFSLSVKDGHSAHISCRGFVRHFGIAVPSTKQYNPAWNEKEDLLEIHLDKPLTKEHVEKATKIENRVAAKQTPNKVLNPSKLAL